MLVEEMNSFNEESMMIGENGVVFLPSDMLEEESNSVGLMELDNLGRSFEGLEEVIV